MLLFLGVLVSPALAGQQTTEQAAKPKADLPKANALKNDVKSEKDAKAPGVSLLRIEVTAGEKDAPVDSASIYVRFLEVHKIGKNRMTEMNVKTNKEGVVKVPSVPRGKTLIQVIAPGWKTFGRWYDLDQAEQTIKIKLEKPPRWY
jgi:hypothetical protein